MEKDLGWSPARVLYGLSRIGYTPSSAICDIIDNSVTAEAEKVVIKVVKENPRLGDAAKNNIREYLIIDDGRGMDEDQMLSALELGSQDLNYGENSLSKFGLGLKSASFSQGDILEVLSGKSEHGFLKYQIDLQEISKQDRYFASKLDIDRDDIDFINEHLPNGHGTIVRVAGVRKLNHPSFKKTKIELKKKLGVIYFYYLSEGLKIILDGEDITPFDPLFSEEAEKNGDLMETEWDGKDVRRIHAPQEVVLDTDSNTRVIIEATQLPHPPSLELPPDNIRAVDTRNKYMIGSSDYGYYVYRNKRLISWAEKFGIIGNAQNLYSFRGRILINESADDAFNIDVKKSNITLSEEASDILDKLSNRFKSKSTTAWGAAGAAVSALQGKNTNKSSNEILEDVVDDLQDPLPGDFTPEEEVKAKRKKIAAKQKDELSKEIAQQTGTDNPSDEQIEEFIRKENPYAEFIYRANTLKDNVLWRPYWNPDDKPCVQINNTHRFADQIYIANEKNTDLQIIFDIFLHQLASAESYMLTHEYDGLSTEQMEELFQDYRHTVSELLFKLCRKAGDKLPPIKVD